MTLHLSNLDELVQKVKNSQPKSYLREAIGSYRASAYRAALITTWISVCVDIIEKVRELSLNGDAAAKVIENRLNAINENDHTTMLSFERELLDIACEELQLISIIEKKHLERLKDDRNICAHPTFSSDGSQFSPQAEAALAYIVQSANYLLIQAPVKGKVVIDRLYELINETSFPEDEEKAFTILSSEHYLGRVRESSVRNLTIILIKRLFHDEEPISPELLNRIAAALGAISRINPNTYNEVIQSRLSKMLVEASDKRLKRLFVFLSKRNEAWGGIDNAIKIRIEGLINSMNVDELISYKITDLSTINININKHYQRSIELLKPTELTKLLSSSASPILKDHAIYLFINSRSFDSAEFNGNQIIIPHCQYLTENDIKSIFEGSYKNKNGYINQILSAGGIGLFFSQFYLKTKEVLANHADIWMTFWNNVNELGYQYPNLRELLEADGLVEPEVSIEGADDPYPF